MIALASSKVPILQPRSLPLSVPHFPGGIWSGLPNLSWVTSEGSRQAWTEALKALAFRLSLQARLPSCCQLLPLRLVSEAARCSPSPCRWRERSWAQFGHACWHRRLKRCVCDCVTVWEPGLTGRPRAALWHLQVFCSSRLVLCPGLHSASGRGIEKKGRPVQRGEMGKRPRLAVPLQAGHDVSEAPSPHCEVPLTALLCHKQH